jgi:acetyl esterase/lipase
MIIAPGGAFMELAIEREGYSIARWLHHRGIAAFVLKYRLEPMPADPQEALIEFAKQVTASMRRARPGGAVLIDLLSEQQSRALSAAEEDAREAIRYVRSHAAQWGLSMNRIGIVGFSAGAAIAVGSALNEDAASRPDLLASIYGALPDATPISTTTPPAFIAVAADDGFASYSLRLYSAWRAQGVSAELHVLENGGHAFGMLHQGKSSDHWLELFDHWLGAHGFEEHN